MDNRYLADLSSLTMAQKTSLAKGTWRYLLLRPRLTRQGLQVVCRPCLISC